MQVFKRRNVAYSHLQLRQDGGEPLCSGSGFSFLLNVSTFSDCFRRIRMRPPERQIAIPLAPTVQQITVSWPANRHPPLSYCSTDHCQLSQLRSIYFAPCGMRHSANNCAYLLSETLSFIKIYFHALRDFAGYFVFSLLVFHKFVAPVGLPTVTMNPLLVTVLWTVIGHEYRHVNLYH